MALPLARKKFPFFLGCSQDYSLDSYVVLSYPRGGAGVHELGVQQIGNDRQNNVQ
jgi:hypothetical protein